MRRKDNKISIRATDRTVERLEWLSDVLEKTKTSIIEDAIKEKFDKEYRKK